MTLYDPTIDMDEAAARDRARALLSDLAEVESELKPLERQREHLRQRLADILEELDEGAVTLPGYGSARLVEAAVVPRWDAEALGRLCAYLEDRGDDALAEMIRACRVETIRAGGLRVERER